MSRSTMRFASLRKQLGNALWLWPAIAVLTSAVVGAGLAALTVEVPEERPSLIDLVIFGGGSSAARDLLQTVAGSVITMTSLVFSLTVVALQLASTAYSPRLLQGFMRDRGNQAVLSIFLATFAYSYMVLRSVPSEGDDSRVPVLAVNLLLLFVLASLAALVYFIHHLTQTLRVEHILDTVQDEALETLARMPDQGTGPLPDPPPDALPVRSERAGHVQARQLSRLVGPAAKADAVVRLHHVAGDYLLKGAVLAELWRPGTDGLPSKQAERLTRQVREAVVIGRERSIQEDLGFGLAQLTDIAVRALSPGTNDPTTAIDALNRVAVVLADVAEHPLPHECHDDADGHLRVAAPTRDFGNYVGLVFQELRHYGSGSPSVARRIAEVLGELGTHVTDDRRRLDLTTQLDLLVTSTRQQLPAHEVALVEDAANRARHMLAQPVGKTSRGAG